MENNCSSIFGRFTIHSPGSRLVTISHHEDSRFSSEPGLDDKYAEVATHSAADLCFHGDAVGYKNDVGMCGEEEEHGTQKNGQSLGEMGDAREASTSASVGQIYWQAESDQNATSQSIDILSQVQQTENSSSTCIRLECDSSSNTPDPKRHHLVAASTSQQQTNAIPSTTSSHHNLYGCLSPRMGRLAGEDRRGQAGMDGTRQLEPYRQPHLKFSRDDGSVFMYG
jgi:hypothetical protein